MRGDGDFLALRELICLIGRKYKGGPTHIRDNSDKIGALIP